MLYSVAQSAGPFSQSPPTSDVMFDEVKPTYFVKGISEPIGVFDFVSPGVDGDADAVELLSSLP